MPDDQKRSPHFAELRRRAEAIVEQEQTDLDQLSREDIERLVHDLQIHKVELELQNDELRTTQQELERSRDRFSELYNLSPSGYLTLDHNGMILRANRTFADMVGADYNNLRRKPFSNFIAPEDRDVFFGRFKAFFNNPESKSLEFVLLKGNGKRICIRMEGRRAETRYSDTETLMVTLSDITRIRETESALRRLNAFLQTVLDAMPAHIAVLDRNGRMIMVNEAWHTFAQQNQCKDSDRYLNRNYLDVCRATSGEDQEEALRAGAGIESVISGEKNDFVMEYPCHSPDRKRWFQLRANPYRHENERGAIVAHIDITDRREAENALIENRNLLRSYLDNIPALVFVKSMDGRIIEINETHARALEIRPETAVGKTAYDLFPKEEADRMIRNDAQVVKTGEPSQFEETITLKDGTHTCLVTKFPIFDAEGRVASFGGIAIDVTKERMLEDRLRQARKMESLGTLTGGIAHEFNNILSIIIGNAELAKEFIPEENMGQENVDEVINAGLRARDVVAQLMSFSRKEDREQRPFDLVPHLQESYRFLRSTISKNIEMRFTNAADTVRIIGNPAQIHQAIINLCANAAQAMEEGGGLLELNVSSVRLSAEDVEHLPELKPGDHAKIRVRDTGVGITPEIIHRIFDPYFTTRDIGKGTGMGLAIVHGIVHSHHGAVEVQSKPGRGATFDLYFPAVVDTEKKRIPPVIFAKLPGGEETILYIDDEAPITHMARLQLERLGYTVVPFNDPTAALAEFKARPDDFDLVVTDMTMPKMNGDRVVEALLSIRPSMPIILCTGYSEKVNRDNALELGVRRFMEKPMSRQALARTVREVLDEVKFEV